MANDVPYGPYLPGQDPSGMQYMQQQGQQQPKKQGFWQKFKESAFGQPARIEQVNKYNPLQQSARQQLILSALSQLQDPTQGFQPIEDKARTQFEQQTLPGMAERFNSMGDNALSSPAFQSQKYGQQSDFEQGIAALRAQYGLQNQSQLYQLLGLGLEPEYDSYQLPSSSGWGPAVARAGLHIGAAAATGGATAIPSALSELMSLYSSNIGK